jgi:hypothetical protein
MSNSPEPPPPLTEKLTVKKVLKSTGVGIVVLSNIINIICIAVIFIYLGSTIPALEPYVSYVAIYALGAGTFFLLLAFLIGCDWCYLRLVAPEQAGSSISEWYSKAKARSYEKLKSSNGKLSKARRTNFAIAGVVGIFFGLQNCFRPQEVPVEFGISKPLMGVFLLICGANSIRLAYVGRVPIRKGARGEDTTMGNNDSQPEPSETIPAGEYKDDDSTNE